MVAVIFVLALLFGGPAVAADLIVKDAATLQLGGVSYRLEGIDAPELDQRCLSQFADLSACGIEARDAAIKLIAGRNVTCRDLGPDPVFKGRRIGACTVGSDGASLSQSLVQAGLAFNSDSNGRFAADQSKAMDDHTGLWKGCFVAPQNFRRWDKAAPLRGAACRDDRQAETRLALFPDMPARPDGCIIKGKLATRARITGHVGVYQLQGCPSYASLEKPNRWFCSEDDARAAGFRKAYNCRISTRR